jgi:hypothetical protein
MRIVLGRTAFALCGAAALLTTAGCARPEIRGGEMPVFGSSLERLQREVRPDFEQHVGQQQALVLTALGSGRDDAAEYKSPLVVQTLTDPWAGTAELDQLGFRLSEQAQSPPADWKAIVNLLTAAAGREVSSAPALRFPSEPNLEQVVIAILGALEEAKRYRDKALTGLTLEERRFLFEHAAELAERFSPQAEMSGDTAAVVTAHQRFAGLVQEKVDLGSLLAAAKVLGQLADKAFLEGVARAVRGVGRLPMQPGWVTGDALVYRDTPYGAILIGGPGVNTFQLDGRVAVLIDLGGDDTYRGLIAASTDVERGLSLLIDLSGNDRYEGDPLGLATGRLGVGLLVDRQGDDEYRLLSGTGGAGFAGAGVLMDQTGDDQYIGSRFTQGVAVEGVGLLLDEAGDDLYTSFAYALGFGGPGGVGAVVDVLGDDRYQCGDTYPSAYNRAEAPDAQPGDPRFQYDCFGLGAGVGLRVVNPAAGPRFSGLAGGLGLLIDMNGHDRYLGANFSQGAGYFFGAGMLLDLHDNDEYHAARYGLAAGAHSAVGLFVDGGGDDRYSSSGPVYSGAAAWDRSVMAFVDAAGGHDLYDLGRSSGLGIAEHGAWSLFVEEGGNDRYLVPGGMGTAAHAGVSGFFDLAGEDDYSGTSHAMTDRLDNRHTRITPDGGLFVDR